MQTELEGVAQLTDLGVIQVQGPDAATFLQGQLTQDVLQLDASAARLAAYCSPQGRMLASFFVVRRAPDDFVLLCGRDLLATTLKRLSMFVLRAKATLRDASADFALCGLAGNAMLSVAGHARPIWSRLDLDAACVVTLYPAGDVARALWLAPAPAAPPAGAALSLERWAWGEVRSGVARISTPTVDAFVPQMLNYESIGGVNFKKGCYPGQEVVARSQFRGTLKRRAFMAHGAQPMHAGDEIYVASDASQPCGKVAQAAPAPQGGFDAIVSLQLSALQDASLHLGSATGAALETSPMPYALLADV